MLRHRADLRTVVFMAITTSLLFVNWSLASFNWGLWAAAMIMAVPVSVMAHNHNHVRIWKPKFLNTLQDYWLTLFYGFPAFGWIPTHNRNHHRLNNREGDYTATWRYTESNNLLTLVTYPAISSYHQQKPIRDFLKRAWGVSKKRFFVYFGQYLALVAFVVAALIIDWKKAVLYIVLPQQFALYSVLIFNYVQHVHADEESDLNHSRNFVGWMLNAYLFNNGFHTVHHENPGIHWSEAPQEHAKIVDQIDPALNETSFWGYILRCYVLGAFVPKLRTRSMRVARMQSSEGEATAEISGAAIEAAE